MRKLRDILQLKSIIDVARGFEAADLVIKGGKIVNVFTGEIIKTDIAVKGDTIAGIGDYSGWDFRGSGAEVSLSQARS